MEEQEHEVVKRGPGRPPKQKPEGEGLVEALQDNPKFEVSKVYEVTYIPGEGDPAKTEMNGIKFLAHVPVKLSRSVTVLVPLRREHQQPDGTIVTRSIETRIPMGEHLKANIRFSVDGALPPKQTTATEREPTTPEGYVGYARAWINRATSLSGMEERWEFEQYLRDKCGVQNKEIDELRSGFDGKRLMLRRDVTIEQHYE